jgi:CarboxypepD_reg-like domain
MEKKRLVLLLFLIHYAAFSQIKGIVRDSISGKPIPYVNIWVENENIGITAEENGEFTIGTSEKNKNLIFSVLGFEKKTIRANKATRVNLKPIAYDLQEVIISNSKKTRQIEIGKTDNLVFQAFDNGPRIDTKFFPYDKSYKKTKFIKQVTIETDSKIESAAIKIHFYNVDMNGYPSLELLTKNLIVNVKKGTRKTFFDITEFNLELPKQGLFVGFEKLIIEKNKTEKLVLNTNTNTTQIQKTYFPFVLYNYVESNFSFNFSGGKWIKTENKSNDISIKSKVFEPAINLILTN